jgi:hypothetical protein
MNAAETLLIARFVKGACPAQKFDEYTPDVWTQLLEDINYDDALAAVKVLGRRLSFIGPPEIRTEVLRIRADRIKANFTEPEYDGDDVHGGLATIRAHRRAVGDGRGLEAVPDFPKRDVEGLLARTIDALPKIPPAGSSVSGVGQP